MPAASVSAKAITPEQSRGARAMLNLTRDDVAIAARVGHSTLVDFETYRRRPNPGTVAAIRIALERAGIEFLDGDRPGVRLAKVVD